MTYNDLAAALYNAWLMPLAESVVGTPQPETLTATQSEVRAFMLRWLDDRALDLLTVDQPLRVAVMVSLAGIERSLRGDEAEVPAPLAALSPEDAARHLLRDGILDAIDADAPPP